MNLIDSHASLQSSHSCKLNTVAWVVELTYLQVVLKCESLMGGHGKERCTVNRAVYNWKVTILPLSKRNNGIQLFTVTILINHNLS